MNITTVKHSDIISISKMLKNSTSIVESHTVVKDIIDHIDKKDSLAFKIEDDKNIYGVWFSKEFEEYTSLSFFYIDKKIRMKPELAVFFKFCIEKVNQNKLLIIKSKDITGFERYVEEIDKDLYQFIGLR